MRILRLGPLFAFSFLCFATFVNAQSPTPTPAPRDAQATSLLQQSLAALTGTTSVTDVTLNANANWTAGSDSETGSATLKATAVGQGRVDLSLSGGSRNEIRDISQTPPIGGWCGTDGAWHATVAHNLFSDPSWFFPAFLINRVLSNTSYAISPMDAETQNGVAVDHVQIYQQPAFTGETATLLQNLSQIDIYLNASTLLPASISFNAHADNNALVNIPIQIQFSNYQVAQGISVPYHVQKYVQNGLVLDVVVTGVQVNSGLPPSDFQIP